MMRAVLFFAARICWAVVLVVLFLAWSFEARAQQMMDVEFWCLFETPGEANLGAATCAASHGLDPRTGFATLSQAQAYAQSRLDAHDWGQWQYCVYFDEWAEISGRRWRKREYRYAQSHCANVASATVTVGPYMKSLPVPECPEEHARLKDYAGPPGMSGPSCHRLPGAPGNAGCTVHLAAIRGFKNLAGDDMRVYQVNATGDACTASPDGLAVADFADQGNMTCTVMSGNVHCWEKDDVDCQYVNGEKWCFSDVDIADLIVTVEGQVLATVPDLVRDDAGNVVPPSSQVEKVGSDGTSVETTVNHYNSGSVGGVTTGGATPNPAQGGRVPGSGSGPGSGNGDGDGEGPGGSLSGGVGCLDPPVCDGDPVLCGVVMQAWRARCVELPTDSEIVAAAGEAPGTTVDGLISSMKEGDGSGWSVQSTFSNFLSDQGGDWWARGGAACVTDPVISLPSSFGVPQLTIELSRWCAVLAMLGQLIMGLAYLQALRIFVGAL